MIPSNLVIDCLMNQPRPRCKTHSANAALYNVVRTAGNNDSCNTGHGTSLS